MDGNQLDNSLDQSGAVYVFTSQDGDEWLQQSYIKAPNPDAGDGFGRSLDLYGDTLAVGATGEDSEASGIDGDKLMTLMQAIELSVYGRACI